MDNAGHQAPVHPAMQAHQEQRARNVQDRVADAITVFSGSMWFVYLHVVWFALWIGLQLESYPYGLLTMIVSLEAIFLSTFVLISQNRQDQARKMFADSEYAMVREEEQQNEELLRLSNEILILTRSIEELTRARTRERRNQ